MSRDWESTFRAWSKPSSETEQQKCENAERMVRSAAKESIALKWKDIDVFAQGSYRNNTNVRTDSDVDICVLCKNTFFYDLSMAQGLTPAGLGIVPGDYTYPQFKCDVAEALYDKFGRTYVTRGNKAFHIHENSYRVDADAVPCFEHRRYMTSPVTGIYYLSGTELRPHNGGKVINWPKQNYENGVAKNEETGNRFKYMVRILKRLRNEMTDNGVQAAKPISSFLIECLVWNVPNEAFGHAEYIVDVRWILAHTFNATLSNETCNEWGEINELKYLFRGGQPWSREQAHAFLQAAWDYVGFQ